MPKRAPVIGDECGGRQREPARKTLSTPPNAEILSWTGPVRYRENDLGGRPVQSRAVMGTRRRPPGAPGGTVEKETVMRDGLTCELCLPAQTGLPATTA